MKREKITLSFFILVFLALFMEFFYGLIASLNSNSQPIVVQDSSIIEKMNIIDSSFSQPIKLSVNSWGRDFFHNRSSIYDNSFNLTGITQFKNGYKAIVNEQIISEGDQIENFKVKDITENSVLLKWYKHSVTLKLEE
tara:strand:- start:807 stop:1220 length:414 start_codon:yes stop_codon:yes gene_type:complete